MYKLKSGKKGNLVVNNGNANVQANNPNHYQFIDLETATLEQLKFIYEIICFGKENELVEKLVEKTATKEK